MTTRRLVWFCVLALFLAALPIFTAEPARATGEVELGAKFFRKCKACHVVGSNTNTVGPTLKGFFGRTAGTVEGFRYSEDMTGSGIVLDEAMLAAFPRKPKDYVKGTKMSFARIASDEDLANLVAYLKHSMK